MEHYTVIKDGEISIRIHKDYVQLFHRNESVLNVDHEMIRQAWLVIKDMK